MRRIRKFGWKLYLWVMSGLLVAVVFYEVFESEPSEFVDILAYGTWTFSLLGVFGFAYDRVVLREIVWRCWLPAIVFWDAWLIGSGLFSEANGLDITLAIGVYLVLLVIALPEYLALYLYGFRSKQIWSSRDDI